MEQKTWMTNNGDIYWNNAVKRKYCPTCGEDLRGNKNAEANLR